MNNIFDYFSTNSLFSVFNYEIFWNSILRILITIIIFFALCYWIKLTLKILNKLNQRIIENWKKSSLSTLTELLNQTPNLFYVIISFLISIYTLNWSLDIKILLNAVSFLIITIIAIKIWIKFTDSSLEKIFKRDKTAKKSISTITTICIRALWIFLFLMNIGIDITPILTWFWIAWIAVAFALQSILTDLFSSFSILLSKPFIAWDLIKVWEWSNEKHWTVKQISLKSTTLTTIQWQDVIIPNSSILSTEVINYRTMKHRRQRVTIGVTYDTGSKKLKKIPELIKEVIDSQKDVKFERCYLESMWDFSINFLISYDITTPDYQKSLEINEKIYLWMVESFEKNWIEFAFPSQTLYIKK